MASVDRTDCPLLEPDHLAHNGTAINHIVKDFATNQLFLLQVPKVFGVTDLSSVVPIMIFLSFVKN